MKKILITGVAGNLGRKIYNHLINKYEITGLDLSNNYCINKFIKCDLRFKNQLKIKLKNLKFDIIIHTAGIAHNFNKFSKEEIFESNFNATKNLVDLIGKNSKLIFFSTIGVYGDSILTNKILNEKTIINPLDFYSQSKMMSENYINNKIPNKIILRCAPIFSKDFMIDIKKRIFYNKFFYIIFGGGNQLHSFCHISNLLKVIDYLINNNVNRKTYNIVDDKIYKSKEIPRLINTNKSIRINFPLCFVKIICNLFLLFFLSKKKAILRVKFHKVLYDNLVNSSLLSDPNFKKKD